MRGFGFSGCRVLDICAEEDRVYSKVIADFSPGVESRMVDDNIRGFGNRS